uniref:Uncharacterized protein n=1 Tax=Glossina austeni TaxID=7395 RepID=A0A1A9V9F4_GLOAU
MAAKGVVFAQQQKKRNKKHEKHEKFVKLLLNSIRDFARMSDNYSPLLRSLDDAPNRSFCSEVNIIILGEHLSWGLDVERNIKTKRLVVVAATVVLTAALTPMINVVFL